MKMALGERHHRTWREATRTGMFLQPVLQQGPYLMLNHAQARGGDDVIAVVEASQHLCERALRHDKIGVEQHHEGAQPVLAEVLDPLGVGERQRIP